MLDFATITGLVMGILCVSYGTFMAGGNRLADFVNIPSVFVTFGGAIFATAAQFPFKSIANFPRVVAQAFVHRTYTPVTLIENLVRYAEIARRDGILALESVTAEIDDEFLVTGLQLAVDGTDPELIQQMLTTELDCLETRHEDGRRILETLAFYLPSFGLLGTVIGLIGMLKNLKDFSSIGANMALALLTTMYGAAGAYMVCLPIVKRLQEKSKEELLVREIIIRGVMAIQSGDNPRIVRQKLKIYLAPNLRPKTEGR